MSMKPQPTRYAYIVACNEYSLLTSLQFCHRDADLLSETLTTLCDFDQANVRVHKLDKSSGETPAELLENLRSLVRQSKDGDTLLFFFAGHGTGVEGDAYLMLPGSSKDHLEDTALSLKEVSDVLRQPRRLCVRVFDACHSGVDVRTADPDGLDYRAFVEFLDEENHEGWVTLASCTRVQSSIEDRTVQQGVFTKCLCDAIKNIPEGDYVQAGSLYENVSKTVQVWSSSLGHSQTPVMNSSLAGAPALAQRIASPTPHRTETTRNEVALLSRLAQARNSEDQLVQSNLELLEPICDSALTELVAGSSALEPFDLTVKASKGGTSLLPKTWERAIVVRFEKLGVQSLHRVESYEDGPTGPYAPLLAFSLSPTIEYRAESSGYPHAVAIATWEGDAFVPGGRLVFYVIPLETKLYLIGGVSVDSVIKNQDGIVLTIAEFAELRNVDWPAIFRPHVERAWQIAKERVEASIRARLDYLDQERMRTNDG